MNRLKAAPGRASENYLSGLNCAQSVMEALGHAWGLDAEPLVRMVTGLGGGIARRGEACGALAAGVLWLSTACGTSTAEEPRDEAYRVTNRLVEAFLERAGALTCAAINGTEDFTSDEHKRRCSEICACTTAEVLSILVEEQGRTGTAGGSLPGGSCR